MDNYRVILGFIFGDFAVGIGATLLIGAGFTLLADEFKAFKAARICFYLATAWIYGKVFMWAYFTSERFVVRATLAFLVCGVVGVSLIEALRLTTHREATAERPGPPPMAPPPVAPDTSPPTIKAIPPAEVTKKSPYSKANPIPLNTPSESQENPSAKTESPFAVSVEWAMFSVGGRGFGTGFWTYYPSPDGCSISPIQAVFFIRVKNLQNTPVTVIGYSLDVSGVPLTRTNMGSVVEIPQKGSIAGPKRPSGYPIERTINFGQGPGFSMVQFPLNESDFAQGVLLQMALIEDLLKTPLSPNVPIRGWAFYQSPNENAFTVAGPLSGQVKTGHVWSLENRP